MSTTHLDFRSIAPPRALFAPRPAGPRITRVLRKVVETISVWIERSRMRRRLLALDDRMLRDVGISRAEVHGEAQKPFWRV